MEEAAKSHQAKCTSQKARREAEAKVKEKAEKRRITEEKKKKKRTLKYIQQLWDEILVKDATLLEGTKGSQVVGSKCKEIPLGEDMNC